jgi:hypothetical protein
MACSTPFRCFKTRPEIVSQSAMLYVCIAERCDHGDFLRKAAIESPERFRFSDRRGCKEGMPASGWALVCPVSNLSAASWRQIEATFPLEPHSSETQAYASSML